MTANPTIVDPDPKLPRHVAIVMDGNGRWANRRRLPRFAGHKAGAGAVEEVVTACVNRSIGALTLFAFSSENWRRPEEEVGFLMGLFVTTLEQQAKALAENNVRLRVIGDRSAFNDKLRARIQESEDTTRENTGLDLVIAANYGGRWDITQAARRLAREAVDGRVQPEDISEDAVGASLAIGDLPEPDLFIRTGGEKRISNFLLWGLAYTELYFTDTLWPDFDRHALDGALASYTTRQRRFGRTGEQVAKAQVY